MSISAGNASLRHTKEHALGDCAVDVTLKKALVNFETVVQQDRDVAALSNISTHVTVQDQWDIAGVPSLVEKEDEPKVLKGGHIVATYSLTKLGKLDYGCEVAYSSIGLSTGDDAAKPTDTAVLARIKESAQFVDTGTSQSAVLPVKRTAVLEQQANHGGFDTALFICTLSFPRMPTFLHVFEPRYRLMIRRAMEGDRTFGMVLHKSSRTSDGPNFMELGTLLRIVNIEFFPDGRSLLETVGVSRFRVIGHGELDGYVVGNIEKIDDISVADEEAIEASETIGASGTRELATAPPSPGPAHPEQAIPARSRAMSISLDDLTTMSTKELVELGVDFVRRMRAQSVAWLTARVLAIYGECPTDPAIFPWWLASILPLKDEEKYRLLGTSSNGSPADG
ncbi:hypothetical protein ABKA04_000072 [Annulohypoxylon sp. FPYF3050]